MQRRRLRGRDHILYAWCAPDALLLPSVIGEQARIISPCRATGQPVTVTVGPDGVDEAQPSGAVVSFATSKDLHNLRESDCDHQHFFISAAAAAPRLAKHSHAFTLSVADAFRLLRHLRCCSEEGRI